MRFALEGKPWTFIFCLRYKAMEKERFSLHLGAHPALIFGKVNVVRDGQAEELLESRRYLSAEVASNYKISDKVELGVSYLYGHGFDDGSKTNTIWH